MLKAKDLQDQTKEELEAKLHSVEEGLYKLRFQASTGRLDRPHVISVARKDIARIKTVLRQKELDKEGQVKNEAKKAE